MASLFPAISLVFFVFSILSTAHSSTIGVDYISRLLEIQERERASPSVQVAAARGVLRRISGVTGVEVLAGLHWYLKYWCGSHISWEKTGGAQLNSIPNLGSLPRVQDTGILVQRPIPWNYYQNAVTSIYTFAWWDWERWEKEIDWMALHGINLPLAFTGQEAIWQKVFKKFNISEVDLDDFFGGPAFLAWSRMGNLHSTSGFSGNVPAALANIFSISKDSTLRKLVSFQLRATLDGAALIFLDATDPLFIEIGRAFIEQQIKEYGRTGHIYNCDTFDEKTPPSDEPDYISALGAAVFKGMQSGVMMLSGDAVIRSRIDGTSMMALLHSVPVGRLVVLDLFAEVKPIWITSEQFYGVPYIWCMLHNFAGNIEMYGILDSIASGPVEARTSENSTMVGVGMSMEGIEQNPVVYDLMSEMAFQHKKVDVKAWIDLYSTRRYGRSDPLIQDAWNVLYHTVYNCTDGAYDKNRDVIVAFPDVDPFLISLRHKRYHHNGKPISRRAVLKENSDSYDHPHLWYSTSEFLRALEFFITSGEELSGSNTYSYDLVDLTRQALAKYANELFLKIIESYQSNDVNGVANLSQKFLDLVEDMDTLLACHEGFLLGPWLESAKQLAEDKEQERQFEWNARTQITMWFDNTEDEASLLRDYGNKYWSGLLLDYYGPRAAIYFKYLMSSLENGHGFPLKDWRREWIKLTNNWQKSRNNFPVDSNGNALIISRWLYEKYLRSPDTYHH
ncbi:hypothetical protein GH714_043308 [Hevea brasiliensis]|uniref:Alpha-N-acetylglucosaminidase n=1 Tax=Hevea brasiliensis TaxID=3981 RepID=A0A6A6K3X7_HEVBR|nr:hypothetical protein GH714_043308 [Hevea brasiliensis]